MGLDLGIDAAGFETVCCVELDKYACRTIRTNTNTPVIEADIHNVGAEDIESASGVTRDRISLVYGGPPCQAFSTAGKQRSLQDFRGNLVLQFLRVVAEIRPEYFILENVRGILYAKLNAVPEEYAEYADNCDRSGSVVHMLVSEFRKLGYTISFSLFDSARYGIPQSRDRFIMFGTLRSDAVPIPVPTHTKDMKQQPHLKPYKTLRDALRGLAPDDSELLQFTPRQIRLLEMIKPGQCWTSLPAELQAEALGGAYHLTGGRTGFFRRLSWDKPSPTLVTSPAMPATMLCHPDEPRPLTVQEYARIQQFPDNWVFDGPRQQIYKQIGNAVPVGLGTVAGTAIMQHIRGSEALGDTCFAPTTSRYHGVTDTEFLSAFELPVRRPPVAHLTRKSKKESGEANRRQLELSLIGDR
jgi:DNA (cytosine-5)-methyltransferase 1